MASKSSLKRVSITVPRNDAKCNAWLDKQSNVSMSLRFLIYDAIARWGDADITMDVLPAAMINAGNTRKGRTKVQHEPQQDMKTNVSEPEKLSQKQEPVAETKPVEQPPVPKQVPPSPPQPVVVPEDPDVDEEGFVDPMAFLGLGSN